jgi:hypothetical protein
MKTKSNIINEGYKKINELLEHLNMEADKIKPSDIKSPLRTKGQIDKINYLFDNLTRQNNESKQHTQYSDDDHQLMFLYALYKGEIQQSPYFTYSGIALSEYYEKSVNCFMKDPLFNNIFHLAKDLYKK